MSQSSDICSHPDIPIERHLAQVAKISIDLVESKFIDFSSLGLSRQHVKDFAIRTALFHDLGKGTSFFQRHLPPEEWKGPNGEHYHAGLSTILAYKPLMDYCKANGLESWGALGPLSAIKCHHGSIDLDLQSLNDGVMEDRIREIKRGLFALPDLYGVSFSALEQSPDPTAVACGIEDLYTDLKSINTEQLVDFRVFTLFLYSVLLEADKAYLAVEDKKLYQREPVPIDADIVDRHRALEFRGRKTKICRLRDKAYSEVIKRLESIDLCRERIYSLTLPTGMGKTLLSASWALKLRERIRREEEFTPPIIIALPFLSIIDQSAQVYDKYLGNPGEELFLKTHSLQSFEFQGYEQNTAEFFMNIWKSQVIMTTFDQLFYSIFSLKPKHLMRFHNLLNSIIILDEVQSLPPHLWHPFMTFFERIAKIGNSRILVMSATQPGFLENASELVPSVKTKNKKQGPERYFKQFSRYKLILLHQAPKNLNDFIEDIKKRLPTMKEKKILIVLDTRDAAMRTFVELEPFSGDRAAYFLSSYVTPAERLERIQQIKNADRVFVVSTQCIEAGVDIDMDYVIRDFGPFDSIIQVAGRCNREWSIPSAMIVEVVCLRDPDAVGPFCPTGEFCHMVYDPTSIAATHEILKGYIEINENAVYEFGRRYFEEIRKRKSWGIERTRCLLDFSHRYTVAGKRQQFDIRKELRGDLKQHTLIVEERKPGLRNKIEETLKITDRWKRRRELKMLAETIARHSISVNAYKFNPEDVAERGKGDFYYLRPGFYDSKFGFNYSPRRGVVII